jgi:hypothetical protein
MTIAIFANGDHESSSAPLAMGCTTHANGLPMAPFLLPLVPKPYVSILFDLSATKFGPYKRILPF